MKTLFFALQSILLLSNFAYAQTETPRSAFEDSDEINRRSALEVFAIKAEPNDISHGVINSAKDVGSFLISGLTPQGDRLPKARQLTAQDSSKVQLIACVDKMIQTNQGAYDGPKVARDILLLAMDNNGWSNDEGSIARAQEKCNDYRSKLVPYSKAKISQTVRLKKLNDLAVENAADKKINDLIQRLMIKDTQKCVQTFASVSASFGFGPGASINLTRCLMSNGEVKNYFGPGVLFYYGVGAHLTMSSQDIRGFEKAGNGLVLVEAHEGNKPEHQSNGEVGTMITLGTGSILGGRTVKGIRMGLGATITELPEAKASAEFRVINSKRRWDMLVDLLK